MIVQNDLKSWDKLIGHVNAVCTYEFVISSEYSIRNIIESMASAVDQNDWLTAEERL